MLRRRRQLAEQDEVRGLEEVAVLGQLLDRISTIQEHALVAVDEGDPASTGGRIHERRVIGHHPEFIGGDLDLAQIHGPNGAVLNGDRVLFARAVIGNRQRVGHAASCRSVGLVPPFVAVRVIRPPGRSRGGDRRIFRQPVVLREPPRRDPRGGIARCRTAARPGSSAGAGSTRRGVRTAPNAAIVSMDRGFSESTGQRITWIPCRQDSWSMGRLHRRPRRSGVIFVGTGMPPELLISCEGV